MNSVNKLILLAAIGTIFAGCAAPKLNTGGTKVRVLTPEEVTSCRELGKTTSSVMNSVVGIDRAEESIAEELETLSRNSAANLGGDTIVPLTVVENGQRTFLVYKCIDPYN
ncbi:MAG: hypothetical protein DRQ59_15910 [Gammaproteobacteria bacterium]|jgi:hypothetical protein|nr:MAG: hypothetical protein DRQ59_15910 [Gammaproteobacteria bacterium]